MKMINNGYTNCVNAYNRQKEAWQYKYLVKMNDQALSIYPY